MQHPLFTFLGMMLMLLQGGPGSACLLKQNGSMLLEVVWMTNSIHGEVN